MEKKPRVPTYRPGDLVQFKYDSADRKKIKRIVCVESLHYQNETEDPDRWDGWYKCHLMFDSQNYMVDPHHYKLECFETGNLSSSRKLIARIGEENV